MKAFEDHVQEDDDDDDDEDGPVTGQEGSNKSPGRRYIYLYVYIYIHI
jgi:hypothetical protein